MEQRKGKGENAWEEVNAKINETEISFLIHFSAPLSFVSPPFVPLYAGISANERRVSGITCCDGDVITNRVAGFIKIASTISPRVVFDRRIFYPGRNELSLPCAKIVP